MTQHTGNLEAISMKEISNLKSGSQFDSPALRRITYLIVLLQ